VGKNDTGPPRDTNKCTKNARGRYQKTSRQKPLTWKGKSREALKYTRDGVVQKKEKKKVAGKESKLGRGRNRVQRKKLKETEKPRPGADPKKSRGSKEEKKKPRGRRVNGGA